MRTPKAGPDLARPQASRLESWLVRAAVLLGCAAAFWFWAQRSSLWEDEIVALTHGLQPLPSFFVEVLRNDIHPFAYFLFLKAWAGLAPASDEWILASSLVTALVSVGVLAWAAHSLGGPRAAWWAAAFYAVTPNFAWSAGVLRMYAWIPCLVVAFWLLSRKHLRSAEGKGKGWLLGALALQAVLMYSHAIQFFFVFFIVLALSFDAFLDRRQPGHGRVPLGLWLGGQAVMLLLALPLAGVALLRGTEPLPPGSLQLLLFGPAQLFTGWGLGDDPLALAAAGTLVAVLVLLASASRETTRHLLLLCALPFAVSVFVGSLGKPMFKPPIFTANLTPFMLIAAAVAVASCHPDAWRMRLAQLALALMMMATVPWSQALRVNENFAPAGRWLAAQARPGDVVIVPRSSVYWGIARYAIGPSWGQPLAVRAPDKPAWAALKHRLGESWTRRLMLQRQTDTVVSRGVPYVMAVDARHATQEAARVFVVHRDRYADDVLLARPAAATGVQWFGTELSITLLETRDGGVTAVSNPQR